jgi:hypothetical protein
VAENLQQEKQTFNINLHHKARQTAERAEVRVELVTTKME